MPWYRFGDHTAHINMTNTPKRPAPAKCRAPHLWPDGTTRACCAISTKLCDWPMDAGQTCDMPLCPEHAVSLEGDVDCDLCPKHEAERIALLPSTTTPRP